MRDMPVQIMPTRQKTRRLVVVSNRTAAGGQGGAGGLAVALSETVRERGGLWFGWSGKLSEAPSAPRRSREGGIDFALLDLTPAEHEGYYLGYANRVLWPLFHYRTDLAQADGAAYETYEAVNRRFARQLAALLRPDDIVWVHDYHLIPLARELRVAGWRGVTGFFLHIPFPAPEVFSALPQHARLARALADYDLVGLQTDQDARNFCAYLAHHRRRATAAGVAAVPNREPRIGVFPIGIDPGEIDALLQTPSARDAEARIRRIMPGQTLALGVDRMDYSKGLPQRLCAFERLLQDTPELRRRIKLVQIASPSRADLDAYARIAAEVDQIAGRINGAFGDLSWTPVCHLARCYSRDVLCGLFRSARIGLVTPLRDGMNLVAKEFVAAQNPADPGVLILSQFAGAAAQLDAALVINPHDQNGVVAAIRRALDMPIEERIQRWQALDTIVREKNVEWWCKSFLDELDTVRPDVPARQNLSGLAQAV